MKYSCFTILCFRCIAKWFRCVCVCMYTICIYFFSILFHYSPLQDIEYRSLCYAANPCCLICMFLDSIDNLGVHLWRMNPQGQVQRHMAGGDGDLVPKLCPTLCNPMDYSPRGSSVHGTSQARTLERVAISFSRGSF